MHVCCCNNATHKFKKLTRLEISGFRKKTFQDGHANYSFFLPCPKYSLNFCVMYSSSRFWRGGESLLILEPFRIYFVIIQVRTSNFCVPRKANDRNMAFSLLIGQISSSTLYTYTVLWYFRVCTRQYTS